MKEATVESERFRRQLLAGGDTGFADADLLAAAILRFRELAPNYLRGHKDIESFDLSKEIITEAIAGKKRISSHRAYGGFKGKLIWITAGEVFLEESYVVSHGVDAYAITGFLYTVTSDTLQATRSFQAVYTREPDNRPEWFSFPLELRVSS